MSEIRGPSQIETLSGMDFPPEFGLQRLPSGKIRERFLTPSGNLVLVTTDKISAFDVVLGKIPHKGQVLNRMSQFWFEKTQHSAPNHMISVPDPNVMICTPCVTIPVEMVVRAVMKGTSRTSIWPMYERGERDMYGVHFREGYKYGDKLDEMIITPTSKSFSDHDSPLSEKEIIENEIVHETVWNQVRTSTLALAHFAQELAKGVGFDFVDAKIESGISKEGSVLVIDELFTPDSAGFWLSESDPQNPEIYDKEYLRIELKKLGFTGDGIPPQLPQELVAEVSRRYVEVFERITEQRIVFEGENIQERIVRNVGNYLIKLHE